MTARTILEQQSLQGALEQRRLSRQLGVLIGMSDEDLQQLDEHFVAAARDPDPFIESLSEDEWLARLNELGDKAVAALAAYERAPATSQERLAHAVTLTTCAGSLALEVIARYSASEAERWAAGAGVGELEQAEVVRSVEH